jgi:hypothetical protein
LLVYGKEWGVPSSYDKPAGFPPRVREYCITGKRKGENTHVVKFRGKIGVLTGGVSIENEVIDNESKTESPLSLQNKHTYSWPPREIAD